MIWHWRILPALRGIQHSALQDSCVGRDIGNKDIRPYLAAWTADAGDNWASGQVVRFSEFGAVDNSWDKTGGSS